MLSGKDGVTHNMLDDIHNHWKRAEAVRIKCLGVPTLDMDNICFHLEVIIWYYMLEYTSVCCSLWAYLSCPHVSAHCAG
jgi:hypothetical protein